jgi:hypothetical protein
MHLFNRGVSLRSLNSVTSRINLIAADRVEVDALRP